MSSKKIQYTQGEEICIITYKCGQCGFTEVREEDELTPNLTCPKCKQLFTEISYNLKKT